MQATPKLICRREFMKYDPEGNGVIDKYDIRNVIAAILENPSETEISKFMLELDDDGCGQVELDELLRAYEHYLATDSIIQADEDTFDAWMALGGDAEKEGTIDVSKLKSVVRDEFQMTIDIEQLLANIAHARGDSGPANSVDFKMFAALFR